MPTGRHPFLFLILLLGFFLPARPAYPLDGPPGGNSASLDVLWERLDTSRFPDLQGWVSVLQGRRDVPDLTSRMFRLFEDGQEQTTLQVQRESEGVVIALLVDTSGSMRESLAKAKVAVQEFVRNLRAEDQVLLLAFSDRPRLVQPLTVSKATVLRHLATLESKGGTALYDSIQEALGHLSGVSGRKVVVLLTDGSDQNAEGTGPGSRSTLDACRAKAVSQEVSIFTIGLGFHVEKKVLKDLAESTEGRSLWASDADQLRALYEEIAQYLRSRYRVTYRTQNPWQDGELRRVRLQVQDGGRFGEGITTYWTSKTMPVIRPPLPSKAAPTPTATPAPVEAEWVLKWDRDTVARMRMGRVRFVSGNRDVDPSSGRIMTHPGGKPPSGCLFDGMLIYLPEGRYRFTRTGSGASVEAVFEVHPGVERQVDLAEGETP